MEESGGKTLEPFGGQGGTGGAAEVVGNIDGVRITHTSRGVEVELPGRPPVVGMTIDDAAAKALAQS